MINKAALDQASAARRQYRADTPLSLYSIEGEDAVFIAAYLEAIDAPVMGAAPKAPECPTEPDTLRNPKGETQVGAASSNHQPDGITERKHLTELGKITPQCSRTGISGHSMELLLEIALAIEEADSEKAPEGHDIDHENVSDWGEHLAKRVLQRIQPFICNYSVAASGWIDELVPLMVAIGHQFDVDALGMANLDRLMTDALKAIQPYIRQPEREAGDPKEVRKFLLHHRLKYTLHGEDGLPLLDRLTPDGVMNTSLGWEEVDLLTEALFEHFDIRRRGSDD